MRTTPTHRLRWSDWPLAAKLTLTMITLILLVVAAITLLSIRREQQTFRTELQQQADLLLDTLEAATINALYFQDVDFLSDIMESLGEDQEILMSGRIYDAEGRIVADAYDESLAYSIESDPFGLRLVESDLMVFEWHPDQLIAGRVVIVGRQRLGAVSVGLPTAPLQRKVASMRREGIGAAIAATVLGILVALQISRSMNKPLQELVNATNLIAKRDLTQKVVIHTHDEFAVLGNAMDSMRAELRKFHLNLEQLVEERTRALSESEQKWHLLYNSLPGGTFVINNNSIIEDVNDVLCAITGYTKDELLGQPCNIICPESSHPCPIYEKEEKQLSNDETIIKTKDGRLVPIVKSVRVIPQGTKKLIIENFQDITDLKRAEEEILRLNEELEERVEERTTELRKANQALQESIDTLKQTQERLIQSEKMAALGGLVAGIAHEINTPLGIGVTAASHLEQEGREIVQLYDEGRMKRSDLERYLKTIGESTQMILRNLQRASNHIQGFKQVAVDQTSGDRRRFKLKAYIDEVLLSLHPRLKKTSHTITVHCPENLELDSYPGAFSQIITNLVMNTLIHGFQDKEQGEIVLDITTDEGFLQIQYSDDGKGMTKDALSRIFEPFYTTNRTQGGTGLGLHIVYNLITQLLQGTITCESTPGIGAMFTIRLPMVN